MRMNDQTMQQTNEGPQIAAGEAACKLVSSRGLLKSMDVRPHKLRSDGKYVHWKDYQPVLGKEQEQNSLIQVSAETELDAEPYKSLFMLKKSGEALKTVYVTTTALGRFRGTILPNVKQDIVLVTGDSDIPPEDVLAENMTDFIKNPRIKKWFAQNTVYKHEKMVQMPIGLDYHTLSEGNQSWGSQATPEEQEKTLTEVRGEAAKFQKRDSTVFTDKFRFSHKSRVKVWNALEPQANKGLFIFQNKVPRTTMWKEMAKHKFIASPRGRGYDCHRTWEILALGSVPLVTKQEHNQLLKDNGLPFIEMEDEDWKDLQSAKMKAKYAEFEKVENEIPEASKLEYWVSKIRRATFE